jgi:hypothetical protein
MRGEEGKLNSITLLRGLKIAEVVANTDPKLQERILVRVLGVHNTKNTTIENAVWAHHCAPTRDGAGDLPEPGDYVYVLFPDLSNPMAIVWLGFVRSSFQTTNLGTLVVPPEEIDSTTDVDEELANVDGN